MTLVNAENQQSRESTPRRQLRGVDELRLARVATDLRKQIERGDIHGANLKVTFRGELILDLVEGYADKAAGTALRQDSVICTMSVAKQFVNVLTLNLVEKGLLSLHAPVAEVLPEFAQMGKESITLAHLFTHTAGMPDGLPSTSMEVLGNIEQLTQHLSAEPVSGRPGERVSYSMVVAQSVIAAMCLRVAGNGRTFADMLSEDLFTPLGMLDTSLGLRADLRARLAPVKMAHDVPGALPLEWVGELFNTAGIEIPAAGMFTTGPDLFRFTEMLRLGGELEGVRLLAPATLDYVTQNFTGDLRNSGWDVALSDRHWLPTPAYLGLGFLVRGQAVRPGPFGMVNSRRTFGGFGAGSNGFWIDPEYEVGVSLLSTGLLEDSRHLERTARLSDLIMTSLV